MFVYLRLGIILSGFLCLSGTLLADGNHSRIAPPQDEKQLPFAMHSSMAQLPVIRIRGETDGLIFEGNESAIHVNDHSKRKKWVCSLTNPSAPWNFAATKSLHNMLCKTIAKTSL